MDAYITPEEADEYFKNMDSQKITPRLVFNLCLVEIFFKMLDEAKAKGAPQCQNQQ